MLHLDTSFLVPLSEPEMRSADVRSFLQGQMSRRATVSHRTRVEFSSLLAEDVRIGTLTPAQVVAADAAFEAFIEQNRSIVAVSNRDFDLARHLPSDHRSGLRAGDALYAPAGSHHGVANESDAPAELILVFGPPTPR